jgi:hypothetical protein
MVKIFWVGLEQGFVLGGGGRIAEGGATLDGFAQDNEPALILSDLALQPGDFSLKLRDFEAQIYIFAAKIRAEADFADD